MLATEPIKAPWISSYGDIPFHLNYVERSLYDQFMDAVSRDAEFPVMSFFGRKILFKEMADIVEKVAKGFYAIGVRPGDRVLVSLPNIPQALYCLYALNHIGATAAMVHPLSAVGELKYYMEEIGSDYAVTLDQFYDKFVEVNKLRPIKKLVVCRVSEELPPVKAFAFKLATERKLPKIKTEGYVCLWKDFIEEGESVKEGYAVQKDPYTEGIILFSGGTTGTTKGVRLSDYNLNATSLQTCYISKQDNLAYHCNMLSAMPIFHGYGIGVCIHTAMIAVGMAILIPRFTPKSYARYLKRCKPNFIVGVPTLFEAIANSHYLDGVDLSCLRGVFCGGDSLSVEMKKKIDKFLEDHNCSVHVREGYGATECCGVSCLTPYNREKEGSIGIPYPDTYYKICKVGTTEEVPYGEEGEICICGPSVMMGYVNHEKEEAETLRKHADGHTWLHTGDLGMMDEEGFVYYRQRIKRMIITNGYNVYPSELENIIERHPAVEVCCVIGVPDPLKIQKVKAFVVLAEGYSETPLLTEELMQHCRKNIAKYAMPYTIEFRDSLPTTLLGKIAYRELS